MNKGFLKSVSLALIQTFIVQQIAFAAPDIQPIKIDLFGKEKPEIHFTLPQSVAEIEDYWKAPSVIARSPKDDEAISAEQRLLRYARNDKVIFLFQDAHTNESGQFNLSKALDIVLEKEGIKHVFVEAGFGNSSLPFFKKYGTPNIRKEVAIPFVKQGVMHGEEYLYLSSEKDFTLWGVEDFNLYKKSIETYAEVAKNREKYHDYLKRIKQTIDTLSPRIFNPLLLSFNKKYESYEKGELSLTEYFKVLFEQAKYQKVSLKDYPNLKLLNTLSHKESRIDFKKATEEQTKAIEFLSPEDQKEFLELAQEKESPFKVSNSEHKEKKAFYALLEEKLADKAAHYPALFKYFQYLKLSKKIEAKGILKEIKTLETEVFGSLVTNSDERALLRSSKSISYLTKLFDLTLTPEEFDEYKSYSKNFGITELTGFLNKKIMDLDKYYERTIFLEPGYEAIVQKSEEFYALTYQRDIHFVKEALKKMEETGEQKAVLISGGYHTPNLKALLKTMGVSYVCVTPQILKETNHKRYEKILLGQEFLRMTPPSTTLPLKVASATANTVGVSWNPISFEEYVEHLEIPIGSDPVLSKELPAYLAEAALKEQELLRRFNGGADGFVPGPGAGGGYTPFTVQALPVQAPEVSAEKETTPNDAQTFGARAAARRDQVQYIESLLERNNNKIPQSVIRDSTFKDIGIGAFYFALVSGENGQVQAWGANALRDALINGDNATQSRVSAALRDALINGNDAAKSYASAALRDALINGDNATQSRVSAALRDALINGNDAAKSYVSAALRDALINGDNATQSRASAALRDALINGNDATQSRVSAALRDALINGNDAAKSYVSAALRDALINGNDAAKSYASDALRDALINGDNATQSRASAALRDALINGNDATQSRVSDALRDALINGNDATQSRVSDALRDALINGNDAAKSYVSAALRDALINGDNATQSRVSAALRDALINGNDAAKSYASDALRDALINGDNATQSRVSAALRDALINGNDAAKSYVSAALRDALINGNDAANSYASAALRDALINGNDATQSRVSDALRDALINGDNATQSRASAALRDALINGDNATQSRVSAALRDALINGNNATQSRVSAALRDALINGNDAAKSYASAALRDALINGDNATQSRVSAALRDALINGNDAAKSYASDALKQAGYILASTGEEEGGNRVQEILGRFSGARLATKTASLRQPQETRLTTSGVVVPDVAARQRREVPTSPLSGARVTEILEVSLGSNLPLSERLGQKESRRGVITQDDQVTLPFLVKIFDFTNQTGDIAVGDRRFRLDFGQGFRDLVISEYVGQVLTNPVIIQNPKAYILENGRTITLSRSQVSDTPLGQALKLQDIKSFLAQGRKTAHERAVLILEKAGVLNSHKSVALHVYLDGVISRRNPKGSIAWIVGSLFDTKQNAAGGKSAYVVLHGSDKDLVYKEAMAYADRHPKTEEASRFILTDETQLPEGTEQVAFLGTSDPILKPEASKAIAGMKRYYLQSIDSNPAYFNVDAHLQAAIVEGLISLEDTTTTEFDLFVSWYQTLHGAFENDEFNEIELAGVLSGIVTVLATILHYAMPHKVTDLEIQAYEMMRRQYEQAA